MLDEREKGWAEDRGVEIMVAGRERKVLERERTRNRTMGEETVQSSSARHWLSGHSEADH